MEILILGNTKLITEDAIKDHSNHYVVCSDINKITKHVRFYNFDTKHRKFSYLMRTYDFDCIVYISQYLNYQKQGSGEMEELRNILSLTEKIKIKKFIYVSSNMIHSETPTLDSIALGTLEDFCTFTRYNKNIDIKIIHSPYMINCVSESDYFFHLFMNAEKKHRIFINESRYQKTDFIYVHDIFNFISRLLEDWQEEFVTFDIEDDKITFEELGNKIKQVIDTEIIYEDKTLRNLITHSEEASNLYYSFEAESPSILDMYQSYLDHKVSSGPLLTRIAHFYKTHEIILLITELILGSFIIDITQYALSNTSQLNIIDLRLVFIMIMSIAYGTRGGMYSALLMIISLISTYLRVGLDFTMMFYNTSYWFPFFLYVVAGAILGHLSDSNKEKNEMLSKDNTRLESENIYIKEQYEEAMNYKDRYKENLLQSRDGFGRIYEVISKLNDVHSSAIFANAIGVIEDVLNNKTVAIYTVPTSAPFARLSSSSKIITEHLPKSIDLDKEIYNDVLKDLKSDNLWINSEFKEDMPTYIASVNQDDEVKVLVYLYDASYDQMSSYYTNLIRIVISLLENFFIRAQEFESVTKSQYLYEDTNFLKNDAFNKELSIQREMAENENATYRIIQLTHSSYSLKEMSDHLSRIIRNTDVLGMGKNNEVYLLALQCDDSTIPTVLSRFKSATFNCLVMKDTGEEL